MVDSRAGFEDSGPRELQSAPVSENRLSNGLVKPVPVSGKKIGNGLVVSVVTM